MEKTLPQLESAHRRIAYGFIGQTHGWQQVEIIPGNCWRTSLSLPDIRAVYAFISKDRVFYIGMAEKSLLRRIGTHPKFHEASDMGATHVAYAPMGESPRPVLLAIEHTLIERYRPPCCGCWMSREEAREAARRRLIREKIRPRAIVAAEKARRRRYYLAPTHPAPKLPPPPPIPDTTKRTGEPRIVIDFSQFGSWLAPIQPATGGSV